MAAENIDYTLSINVEKDVADLVINDDYSYMPVVEILQDTAALILTNDEKIEWVEVNKNAPSTPPSMTRREASQSSFKMTMTALAGSTSSFRPQNQIVKISGSRSKPTRC